MTTSDELTEKFAREVLSHGAQACLPHSLSDEWLQELEHQGRQVGRTDNDSRTTELVAAILQILAFQDDALSGELTFTEEEFYQKLVTYRLELILESTTRKTNQRIKPSTLQTVFEPRELDREMLLAVTRKLGGKVA